MNGTETLKRFRSIGLLLLFAALAFTTPAFAVDVTYSTTGSFNGGGSVLTLGNLTITYTPVTSATITDSSTAQFGSLSYAYKGAPTVQSLNGNTFALTVTQTGPSAGTEVLHDGLTGSITNLKQADHSKLTFNTASSGFLDPASDINNPQSPDPAFEFTVGAETYWVNQVTPINAETTGNSTINGFIESALPEPAFYGLTGTGFVGLFFLAIRRRQQKAAESAAV